MMLLIRIGSENLQKERYLWLRCHNNTYTSCTKSTVETDQDLRWKLVQPFWFFILFQSTWEYWHTYDRWVIGPTHGKAWGGIMIKPYDHTTLCPWKLKWFRSQRWWGTRFAQILSWTWSVVSFWTWICWEDIEHARGFTWQGVISEICLYIRCDIIS